MSFWEGFEKRALKIGFKGVNPLSSAGKMVGNKPSTLVSTRAAFKPLRTPSASITAASNNLSAKLPTKNSLPATPKKQKGMPSGPAGSVI